MANPASQCPFEIIYTTPPPLLIPLLLSICLHQRIGRQVGNEQPNIPLGERLGRLQGVKSVEDVGLDEVEENDVDLVLLLLFVFRGGVDGGGRECGRDECRLPHCWDRSMLGVVPKFIALIGRNVAGGEALLLPVVPSHLANGESRVRFGEAPTVELLDVSRLGVRVAGAGRESGGGSGGGERSKVVLAY